MQYVIRGKLDSSDPSVAHLRSINENIIDTKTNRDSTDKSKVTVSFSSSFRPQGLDLSGEYILTKEGEVINEDCAFINTKYDKAIVQIVYEEHAKKGVNLTGFKVLSLTKGERPEKEEGATSMSEIKKLLNSGA